MTGFKARVGIRIKQDAALSISIMVAKQKLLETEWEQAVAKDSPVLQREVAENAAFFLFLFCGSLRGFEGPMVLLGALRSQIVAPGSDRATRVTPHVGLPLSGRFKARSQEKQNILIPIAFETASGLQPGIWALRLVRSLEQVGISTGWAFQTLDGEQRSMSSFNDKFIELLLSVHSDQPINPIFFQRVSISRKTIIWGAPTGEGQRLEQPPPVLPSLILNGLTGGM